MLLITLVFEVLKTTLLKELITIIGFMFSASILVSILRRVVLKYSKVYEVEVFRIQDKKSILKHSKFMTIYLY